MLVRGMCCVEDISVCCAVLSFVVRAFRIHYINTFLRVALRVPCAPLGLTRADIGEVELYQPNGEQRLVTAGNAITHAASGVVEPAELTPDQFLGLEALDDRVRSVFGRSILPAVQLQIDLLRWRRCMPNSRRNLGEASRRI